MEQRVEGVDVEALVADPAVERLDVAVAPRRPGRDVTQAGAGELRIQILPLADDAPVLVCAGRPAGCGVTAARVETPGAVPLR
ncbi:hypothetical protein [uncultured Tessaracoccus sp.]|uniref:hypothetical protein n=1 Tax=uncultured Tessaracoccus sp. TaxID=905023 RepID=UPI0026258EAD|nr:hypothetical protein [uncultured Tessaracoccus sp.]